MRLRKCAFQEIRDRRVRRRVRRRAGLKARLDSQAAPPISYDDFVKALNVELIYRTAEKFNRSMLEALEPDLKRSMGIQTLR